MINKIFKLSEVSTSKIAALLQGKAGIYQWINMINNKTYVGSSRDLQRRFLEYQNPKHLARELIRGDSIIYRALLKHGYSVFGFKILALVEVDSSLSNEKKKDLLQLLEQKYIETLKPEYNILPVAGSNRSHSLSEKTKAKMSASKKGKPSHRKGTTHTEVSKELMKQNNAMKQQVFIYTAEMVYIRSFDTITECAAEMKISRHRIGRAIRSSRVLEGYVFSTTPPFST